MTATGAITVKSHDDVEGRQSRSLRSGYPGPLRLLILVTIIVLFFYDEKMRVIVTQSMADAFLQVTVFVAGTLALVFWLEHRFSFSLGEVMRDNLRWQPIIASALGVLPGCGGAIIVVVQFTKGYASFGALISVLVATMGDAAFLLIARDPSSFLIIIAISLAAGIMTGMICDKIHGPDFLATNTDNNMDTDNVCLFVQEGFSFRKLKLAHIVWIGMIILGLTPAILIAFRVDVDVLFGSGNEYSLTGWFGFLGAFLSIVLWAFAVKPNDFTGADSSLEDPLALRVVKDTNFVTGWVVVSFLLFEIFIFYGGIDIGSLFRGWVIYMPLIAILIGFIPGCGAQIIVASLYLAGAIPLSAQLANAISNDGDALFPALALAPKAALLATLYSAIPAFVAGYGWMFLFAS